MKNFVKCSVCGISEPAEDLIDGVCNECKNSYESVNIKSGNSSREKPVNMKKELLATEAAGAFIISALSAYAGVVILGAMSVAGYGRVTAIGGVAVSHDKLPLLAILAFVLAAAFTAFGIKKVKQFYTLGSHKNLNSSVPPKDACEHYKWANRLPPYDD